MTDENVSVLFRNRPVGWPDQDTFELARRPMPELADGDVLVKNLWLSVDPYMRGRMSDRKSYVPGFRLGEPLQGGAVGRIVASRNPAFQEGTYVSGMLTWSHYTAARGGRGLMKVDPKLGPLSWHLGALGMPGLTAWVGLLDIGRPREGETLVVSAAAGAVGQLVGQIGKLKGLTVVGSAGDDAKVAYLGELGFDAAFNYKTTAPADGLKAACPDGVDVYFDNVGGAMLDAVLARLKVRARIVCCGMISQYNLERPEGVRNLMALVGNRARMEGFIVTDHYDRMGAFVAEMAGWLNAGTVKYREDRMEGIENAPAAFLRMLRGENFGKQVVKLQADG